MASDDGGPPATRRFSTGAQFLDFRLGGGLPAGRLLVLLAPPDAQSELLLHSMASGRRTHVFSTISPDAWEFGQGFATGPPASLSFEHVPPAGLHDAPAEHLEPPMESYLIVDADKGLETDREGYLAFLDALKARLRETESVGVLHLPDDADPPALRSLTLKRADQVWRLEQRVESREIKTRLLVTKARGTRALTEPIPLILTDRIHVDTSRRIA